MRRKNKDDPHGFAEAWARIRRQDQKLYVGRRTRTGKCVVQVVEGTEVRPLPLARSIMNHSLSFEWGYTGSGPAQLALALLCDCLKDNRKAVLLHQGFNSTIVGNLPKDRWELRENVIKETAEMLESSVNYGVSDEGSRP